MTKISRCSIIGPDNVGIMFSDVRQGDWSVVIALLTYVVVDGDIERLVISSPESSLVLSIIKKRGLSWSDVRKAVNKKREDKELVIDSVLLERLLELLPSD